MYFTCVELGSSSQIKLELIATNGNCDAITRGINLWGSNRLDGFK